MRVRPGPLRRRPAARVVRVRNDGISRCGRRSWEVVSFRLPGGIVADVPDDLVSDRIKINEAPNCTTTVHAVEQLRELDELSDGDMSPQVRVKHVRHGL
jgi:hypothetical protein